MKPRWKAFGLLTLALVVLMLILFTYIGAMGYFELDEEEITLYPDYEEGRELVVENIEGSIDITGWEKDNITVVGIKKTYFGEKYFENIQIKIDSSDEDVLKILVKRDIKREWVWMNLKIHVPEDMKIRDIDSEGGDIRILNMKGDLKISTDNGAVRVEGFTGDADIDVENGEVRVVESRGNFSIDCSNGNIYVRDVDNLISADTENGWIHVHETTTIGSISTENGEVWVKDSGTCDSITVDNGRVLAEVDDITENGLDINVGNGEIDLTIPNSIAVNFTISIENGEINLRNIQGADGTSSYRHGSLNGGGPLIDIELENGDIYFRGE